MENLVMPSAVTSRVKGFYIRRIDDSSFVENPFSKRYLQQHKIFTVSMYILSSGGIEKGNQNQVLEKSLITFSPPDTTPFPDQIPPDLSVYYIAFTEAYLLQNKQLHSIVESLPFFKLTELKVSPLELHPTLSQCFKESYEKILDEYYSDNIDQVDLISSYLLTFFLLIKRLYSRIIPISKHQLNTAKCQSAIITNKFIDLLKTQAFPADSQTEHCRSVAYFANCLNVHPNYLNSVVKKETGMTAHDLIMSQIISYSKLLLHQTTLSIKEIAFRLFFYDVAHFSTIFKKHTSFTPTAYRSMS